jgi:hypothetical protein
MDIIGNKKRATIKGNRPLLEAAVKIIYGLKDFWPLSDRTIHYQLLNDPPLKHKEKPYSTYTNDKYSYNTLTNVLTRGRLSGEIPWEAIADDTRPVIKWDVHRNISPFVKNQFDRFMKGYFRDYMQSQPNQIEILGEKLTIQSIIRPVAMEYTIPYTIGRGYSSINPRREIADRFKKSGKEEMIVLILSDFDPDGEEIAQSFSRSMRDDFDVTIQPVKVALTSDQIIDLNLPIGGEAKKGSSNYKKFVAKYGKNVYELEAIKPQKIQEMLDDAIKSVLDMKAFNDELDEEGKEFLNLAEYRKKTMQIFNTKGFIY